MPARLAGHHPRRHPHDHALARQPAVRPRRARAPARARRDRVRRHARARRAPRAVARRRSRAQRGLGPRRVPELRGSRGVGRVPRRAVAVARARRAHDLRDHVRGGGVVALPPPDRRRPRDHARRPGVPHLHRGAGPARDPDAVREGRPPDPLGALPGHEAARAGSSGRPRGTARASAAACARASVSFASANAPTAITRSRTATSR